jgi:SAM-dependent methyltransferase
MWRFGKWSVSRMQRALWFLLDLRKDAMTPPRRLMNVGSNSFTRSDFHAIGRTQMGFLVEVGGLQRDDAVLDVGCGVGRMAIQLTSYLSARGAYRGFDVVRQSVDHCRRAITPRFPSFQFDHVDIQNSSYNPRGTVAPQDFRFPYADASFSFVFLTSVFTHMQWPEVERYIAEIRRVLVQGGRVFATYFLINPESESGIRGGSARYSFAYPGERSRVELADDPDAAVAFDETSVLALYAKSGMDIVSTRYGFWSGRQADKGFQDIVVAVKR